MPRVPAFALALTGLLGLLGTHVQAGHAQSRPPEISYRLHARLAPDRRELSGEARIELTHHARAPLHDVVLHLYANAFEHARTVFAREGGPKLRGVALEHPGSIELRALTTEDGADLLARAERELVPNDRTQLRAHLPTPLAAGERLVLNARFVVHLPSLVARMGQARDFCMIAQWFPKLARLTHDGRWQSTPYHGAAEFDADFADYDLSVDVPDGFVVAAPGEPRVTDEAHAPGRRVVHHVLRRARDLAWAASPSLARTTRTHGALRIEVFAPRGHASLAARQAVLTRDALAQLGAWLGAYPHARIAVVLPPAYAAGAAGMEYAGLVVGAPVRWHSELTPLGLARLDAVTAHELAHQWFPMIVANDEVAAPWLDEGLSEWLGLQVLARRYPRAAFVRLFGIPVDVFDLESVAVAAHPDAPSSLSTAVKIGMRALGPVAYGRPALVLEHLARTRGRARLQRALASYAHAHRFRQVAPPDLFRALDDEYGAGFSARELIPQLEGHALRAELLVLPARGARGDIERASTSKLASAPPLLARLLFAAQTLLGMVGP